MSSVGAPLVCVDKRTVDAAENRLRCERLPYQARQDGRQGEEPATRVPHVLRAVRVKEQGVTGFEIPETHGGQLGRQGEQAQGRVRIARGELAGARAAQPVGPRVPAVQGEHLAVGPDLHEQQGHELLGDARRVLLAQMPGQGAFHPAQYPAEVLLVVRGLAETAEHGGDGPERTDPVPAYVTHHGPYAVLGGDGLVQVAADLRPTLRRQLGGGNVQPVDPRRRRPQQRVLRGTSDPAQLAQLAHQRVPHMQDQRGTDGEEDGTGDDPRLEMGLRASGQASLYVTAAAPHSVGRPRLRTRPLTRIMPMAPQ